MPFSVLEAVVANSASASAVAFIATGPQKWPKHVLYVGVSYTGNGPYRSDVPAVSSRSLDPNAMFTIAANAVTTGTRLLINSLAGDRYPIKYVYGFQSRGFSYFLTVQKKSDEQSKPFISKLVRVCQKDADYYSYTEVRIMCRNNVDDYNLAQAAFVGKPGSELATSLGITAQDDILYVVFAKSNDESGVYDKPVSNSALCVYALSAVHRKFTQNIQHCYNGNGNQGLDFINIIQSCVPTQLQINDDFCGTDVNTPLGGSMPIKAAPVLSYNNELLTSVAATSTHDFTVVFLGTSNGHLKKAVIESSVSAFQFSDVVIDEASRVNPDMYFVDLNHKNYLYVMTERRVTMVKVQDCQIYRMCTECVGARDPYCGWCSLENKCSLRSDCGEAAHDPLHWLSYKNGKCTTITHVKPPHIQRTTTRALSLVIDRLPVLVGRLLCAFTDTANNTQTTEATRCANGVICPTPAIHLLPPISPAQHYFTVKLSVRSKFGADFVATNFTFYDCSSYTSCTECVSSAFPCDWCFSAHRCIYDTEEDCRNDILVSGISSIGPSIRSGADFCPRINATAGGTTEVLVPSGISKRIQVKVDNIPQFIVSTRFVCQFNIEGRVKRVNAQLLGDTVYCERLEFAYATNEANITASFAVIWDESKPLDNPENIHVLVYRCQRMASNCGFCLESQQKYSCGWCEETDSCQVEEQCGHHNTTWLNTQQTCPNPKILDFYPKSVPWEGGTNLTIEGINLGRTFDNIVTGVGISHEINGVTVGFINCIPQRESYVNAAKIICQLQSPRNLTTRHRTQLASISGPIVVKVLNEVVKSREHFSFVNPKVLTIFPTKGPKSGGTLLLIEGLHMNAGSKAEVFLGSVECNVTRRQSNFVECITGARHMPGEEKVSVKFDNQMKFFDYYNFLYVDDPKILSVDSGSSCNRGDVRGIPSGGICVTVKGEYLNIIQKPIMYVLVNGQQYTGNCTPINAIEMRCESPSVTIEEFEFPNDRDYVELDFGFIMDSVRSVKSLSTRKYNSFQKFKMFRNPVYMPFTEENGVKFYRSDYLTINGKNVDSASQETDVTVWIGNSTCNVTSLSRLQLTCRPIAQQPYVNLEVIVGVGGRLNFTIGKLSYEQ